VQAVVNARGYARRPSPRVFRKAGAEHFRFGLGIDRRQPLVVPGGQSAVARASSPSLSRALPVESIRAPALIKLGRHVNHRLASRC
jgi:hypothetical protein